MVDVPIIAAASGFSLRARILRVAASRGFQAWAARVPILRRIARAEGAALFDIVAGFVNAQTLMALVELRVLHLVQDGPLTVATLAQGCDVAEPRMQVLLQAGAALGLLRREGGGFGLALRGAAMLGVPGLEGMVLVNNTRLSVQPVSPEEWEIVCRMGGVEP